MHPTTPTVVPHRQAFHARLREIFSPFFLLLTRHVINCAAVISAMLFAAAPVIAAEPAAPAPAAVTAAPVQSGRSGVPPVKAGSQTFNTVITKLHEGKQIFSNTVSDPDLAAVKKACEGQDFIWIEMQHSTLTWRETQQIIKVVAEAGCIPFVRVPTANEGDIQKATDAGALGIIVPMVDSVEEARNAVMFSKFPIGHRDNPNVKPWGHRSSGGAQAPSLWGSGYSTNANNNILVMLQIENPAGVGVIDDILEEVPGIDIVMVASNDFGQHGGDRDGDASYNAREKLVREAVLSRGKILAGPSSWQDRPGYRLFQGRRNATNTGYDARGDRIPDAAPSK
jgi:2-keto-3-deoxy-L-rhamnonate aldolase RhmA